MLDAQKIYDESYAQRYQVLASTNLGKAIYHSRWTLIEKHCPIGLRDLTVLDYGSGPGAFHAHGPNGYTKFNYDINPTCGFTDKVWRHENIDILTMWDSIEHIPNFYGEIKEVEAEWLFISTPNLDSVTSPFAFWKHRRPKEHIYHFTKDDLEVILDDLGYKIVECNYDEGRLRDPLNPAAILTLVARRRED
jgi:hypothetical protein